VGEIRFMSKPDGGGSWSFQVSLQCHVPDAHQHAQSEMVGVKVDYVMQNGV